MSRIEEPKAPATDLTFPISAPLKAFSGAISISQSRDGQSLAVDIRPDFDANAIRRLVLVVTEEGGATVEREIPIGRGDIKTSFANLKASGVYSIVVKGVNADGVERLFFVDLLKTQALPQPITTARPTISLQPSVSANKKRIGVSLQNLTKGSKVKVTIRTKPRNK